MLTGETIIMASDADQVLLTDSQAACLHAVLTGVDSKSRIAVETKRDLRTTSSALDALRQARLIDQCRNLRWQATKRGQSCTVRVVQNSERARGGKRLGELVAGSTAERLLAMLDRPRMGKELAERLGVTTQRIRQLVVRLYAQGRLRLGDQAKVLHIVARADDLSILLTCDEERLLSALPDDACSTVTRMRAATSMSAERARYALARLEEHELIKRAGSSRGHVAYRLSPAGSQHFQRRTLERRADPVPLKVQSNRVFQVLSHLSDQGAVRIKDVRDALKIPHQSMNALMQYLKRRGLVAKVGSELSSPYRLTADGLEVLTEMNRRAQK
jgi:DNA-binding MarR family transcriptional regulator